LSIVVTGTPSQIFVPGSALESRNGNILSNTYTRAGLQADIIELIRSEIQDKSTVLTMSTPRDQVEIDSIDIVETIFKIEEKYAISVNLPLDAKFETVGDLVTALMACFPPGQITDA
jgi:acyl carrier protein